MCTCTGERSAALPLCHVVGHDGFSGQQVRVFNVADHLCGGLSAQLQGVDVNRGKLRSCQLCKDGVIEGDDGKLLRDLNPDIRAEAFQPGGQNIVADDDAGRPLRTF